MGHSAQPDRLVDRAAALHEYLTRSVWYKAGGDWTSCAESGRYCGHFYKFKFINLRILVCYKFIVD